MLQYMRPKRIFPLLGEVKIGRRENQTEKLSWLSMEVDFFIFKREKRRRMPPAFSISTHFLIPYQVNQKFDLANAVLQYILWKTTSNVLVNSSNDRFMLIILWLQLLLWVRMGGKKMLQGGGGGGKRVEQKTAFWPVIGG